MWRDACKFHIELRKPLMDNSQPLEDQGLYWLCMWEGKPQRSAVYYGVLFQIRGDNWRNVQCSAVQKCWGPLHTGDLTMSWCRWQVVSCAQTSCVWIVHVAVQWRKVLPKMHVVNSVPNAILPLELVLLRRINTEEFRSIDVEMEIVINVHQC